MLNALLAESPVVLAPMENVTDGAFRAVCRALGAVVCVTEFIGAEQVIADSRLARRRAYLAPGDRPTAIQIYGPDPRLLLAAARIAADARPAFVDINCGCWVPKIVRRGAGAAWLRDPAAMVEMARAIVAAVDLPVTVKTRIGFGPESEMPIVDLARRLEDAGVAGLTIHCRTAVMGHTGDADWAWARRAREVVRIPVIVNGDVRTADDVARALAETGCAGVMIGRAAIAHPWVFREARARLAGQPVVPPDDAERRRVYRAILEANVAVRGEADGVGTSKRHLGVLGPALGARRPALLRALGLAETIEILEAG
ncbi:MAG TPA: tRNA-dihydrouridine synthase family protein [Kofleriaceae bacterium]|nr:tRNA-dihydrouridine synthase family protein [Kofleriaceae bacterium]